MPMFLYFNATFLGPLLAPLLDAQDSLTGMLYAAQDLGRFLCRVLNHSVEQCLIHGRRGIPEGLGNAWCSPHGHRRYVHNVQERSGALLTML